MNKLLGIGAVLFFLVGFNRTNTDPNVSLTSKTIFKSDTHFVINEDTFLFLTIEKDSTAQEFLSSSNVQFWKKDIQLTKDSFLVVNQSTREIIDVVHHKDIHRIDRASNLTSLGQVYGYKYGIHSEHRIKFVRGRKDFFDYKTIGPKLKIAHSVFTSLNVDPVIAQLLLLIESPNDHKGVSHSGAAGHFQIMPSVARRYGLKTTGRVDERLNFYKSAVVAAKLIKNYCVPNAKLICTTKGIAVDTAALWFKLLVLHIYNAGAGTLKVAVRHIDTVNSGNELIRTLWNFRHGHFQNSSQNYSQVCLGSYLGYKEFLEKSLQKTD